MIVSANEKNERGQALTETAIALPLIIFLVLCIVQLAVIYLDYQLLQYAAFCSARAAVVNFDSQQGAKSSADHAARIVMAASSLKSAALVTVTLTSANGDATVECGYPVRIFLPGLNRLFGYDWLTARCTMKIEREESEAESEK